MFDDLFNGCISGSDVNIIVKIINYSYLNELWVIVSCENGIDEIMNIDEAIGSRLYEMSCGYVASLSGSRLIYMNHYLAKKIYSEDNILIII